MLTARPVEETHTSVDSQSPAVYVAAFPAVYVSASGAAFPRRPAASSAAFAPPVPKQGLLHLVMLFVTLVNKQGALNATVLSRSTACHTKIVSQARLWSLACETNTKTEN